MSVITDGYCYNFVLRIASKRPAQPVYHLKLLRPETVSLLPLPMPQTPESLVRSNTRYSYVGSRQLLPAEVFDDGHSTFFRFADQADYPAIFVSSSAKLEEVGNTSMRQGYIVVDQVAQRFTLRKGSDVTQIFNDGFKDPEPGPLSPPLHTAKK